MAILRKWTGKLEDESEVGGYNFYCPGCKEIHSVRTIGKAGLWSFNDSEDRPTFQPSILVKSGHYFNPDHCWCSFYKKPENNIPNEKQFKCYICHSYITDGNIQFLEDCSHELAGKTVHLPEFGGSDELV
jgi:hypothetical protein